MAHPRQTRVGRAAHALRRGPKSVGRLGIRGKLNLLLLLPLAAVLLVAVPFVIGQVDNARSAGRTADLARQAREVGGLISELQRERLLTAAYVASPAIQSADMERQQRTVTEAADAVRSSLGANASDELTSALVRLGSLQELRQNALRRGASLDSVARTYHAVISAIIDAIRLVPQVTSDAEGTRQLTALEALLRAGEQNSLRGMALIVAAVNQETGLVLLDDASAQAASFTERFVQQADVEHAGLVVRVEQGEEGRRVDALVGRLPEVESTNAGEAFVTDALAAVDAQSSLRRIVQDRVTGQISDAAAARADTAGTVAWTVGLGAAGLFVLVALLAVVVARSIANPLRRLTTAAASVANLADSELVRVTDTEVADEQVPRLSAIDVSSGDELGRLAAAFNRVQATAAMLVERQAVTRRNVGLMFANVAKRTQNLVGRQLALVDELERDEQDTRLLERLYRLDHLSTRLRRNADNLLVVAGSRDETKIGGPTELATVLRSALAEIEDYQRVRLVAVGELTLASSLGSDLILMFAELLENATSFSPPDTFVDVGSAFLADGSCLVSIIDHGIGMSQERLAQENQRLVERERLDIAPTSLLGLFVVGRLARRHSLSVVLVATQGRGVTARLVIPAHLFTRPAAPERIPAPAAAAQPSATAVALSRAQPLVELKLPPARHTAGFSWFPAMVPQSPVPAPPPAVPALVRASTGGDEINRSGLKRRVAGAQLPGSTTASKPSSPAGPPRHDPAAVRAAMDDYQSAIAKAAGQPPAAPPPARPPIAAALEPELLAVSPPVTAPEAGHGGLTRRVPGANLAPGLRNQQIPQVSRPSSGLRNQVSAGPRAQAAPNRAARNPDAERVAFDAFASGLARAVQPTDTVPQDAAAGRDTDPTKGSQG